MYCAACGDPLSIEEMDWNEVDGDSLCDNCYGIYEDGDDPWDPLGNDDEDWVDVA